MRSDTVEKWDKTNPFFNSITIIDNKLMGVIARMDFLRLAAAVWVSDFRKKVFIVCRNKTTVVSSFKHWFCSLFNIYLLHSIYVVRRKLKTHDFTGFWVTLVTWVASTKCRWFLSCVLRLPVVYNISPWKYTRGQNMQMEKGEHLLNRHLFYHTF